MKHIYLLTTAFICLFAYGQTPEQIAQIQSHYDMVALKAQVDSLVLRDKDHKENLPVLATLNNWPQTITMEDGQTASLVDYDEDEKPVYHFNLNINAAKSTRTNFLNTGGGLGLNLNGNNMHIGVWERYGGRLTHQELTGRVSAGDSPEITEEHATMVLGTLIASGVDANAKGMAPEATATLYTSGNDLTEVITEIGNSALLFSNHSYGNELFNSEMFGKYTGTCREWDGTMENYPYYLMVVAAGNYGANNIVKSNPSAPGYDRLLTFACIKNNLVVASADDASVDALGNLTAPAAISTFSSQGPTDDLRIKPDITGNGKDVYSSAHLSDTDYETESGTSMAAPNVAGSLLLLQEYAYSLNGQYMKASTVKGLALHTADDMLTTGPDAISGWGLLNAKRAAETLRDNGAYSIVIEKPLYNSGPNATDTYTVYSDGIHPLQASISWTDIKGNQQAGSNNPLPRLKRDLDIRVTQGANTYYPWRLTSASTNANDGDNITDPYERIDIPNAAGEYTITVTHKTFPYSATQNYSLIVTGIVICSTTAQDISITSPYTSGETVHEHVVQTITASNIVGTGADVHYRAGEAIMLTPGFYSENNSEFLADIGSCGGTMGQYSSARQGAPQEDNDETITEGKRLTVYPNPATDSVTVSLPGETISSLLIVSIDGKPVMKIPVNKSDVRIETGHLQKGLYILSIETAGGERLTEKLILN